MPAVRRRRPWLVALAVLGSAAVHGSCADATGPAGELVRLRLAPSFEAPSIQAPEGAVGAVIDNIRFRAEAAGGVVLLDTVAAWPAEQDTLRLQVSFRAPAGVTSFGYRLEARVGDEALFADQGTFDISAFWGGATLSPVLEYVGPGAGAVAVAVVGPASILAGDTVRLTADVLDDAGSAIPDVAVEWSVVDAASGGVDAAGLLTAGDRLDLELAVAARVPYLGLADTLRLGVLPAGVRVTGRSTLVAIGDTATMTAEALTVAGAVAAGATFSWSTPETTALGLTPAGATAAVEALTTGTARVIAAAGARADTLVLELTQVVASVLVAADTLALVIGDTASLTAEAFDATGHLIPDAAFTWTAADPLTADLLQPGLAFAVAPGHGVVEATAGGHADSVVVDVAGFLIAVQHPDSVFFTPQIHVYHGDAAGDSTLFLSRDTLTSAGATHASATWSPDGTSVAYIRNDSLFVQQATAGALPTLLVPGDLFPVSEPAWSPDGTRIAFAQDTDIATVDPAGGVLDILTDVIDTLLRVTKSSPTWSPDGKRIAFTIPGQTGSELWIFEPGTGAAAAVTLTEVTSAARPAWSPVANLIAFEGTDAATGAVNIWVVDPDAPDTSLRRLSEFTGVSGFTDANPAWSPNGKLVVFDYESCGDGCFGSIAAVDPAATSPPRVILDLTNRSVFSALFPAWGRPAPPVPDAAF